MEKGEIVEAGDPEDLLRIQDSMYNKLAREQGINALPATHHHGKDGIS
jgi:ABC-type multidrug transport system fused ATPase/permease subunit